MRDADYRAAQVLVGESDRLEVAPGWSPIRPIQQNATPTLGLTIDERNVSFDIVNLIELTRAPHRSSAGAAGARFRGRLARTPTNRKDGKQLRYVSAFALRAENLGLFAQDQLLERAAAGPAFVLIERHISPLHGIIRPAQMLSEEIGELKSRPGA